MCTTCKQVQKRMWDILELELGVVVSQLHTDFFFLISGSVSFLHDL